MIHRRSLTATGLREAPNRAARAASSGSLRQPESEVTLKAIQIPVKFTLLIESITSIGEMMISDTGIESPTKTWAIKLSEPIVNVSAYIARAADAQIILYHSAPIESF
jgi:hypothetical protein